MKPRTRLVMSGVLGCLLGIIIGYGIEGRDSGTIVDWISGVVTSLPLSLFHDGYWNGDWRYSPLVWAVIGTTIGILIQILLPKAASEANEETPTSPHREWNAKVQTPASIVAPIEFAAPPPTPVLKTEDPARHRGSSSLAIALTIVVVAIATVYVLLSPTESWSPLLFVRGMGFSIGGVIIVSVFALRRPRDMRLNLIDYGHVFVWVAIVYLLLFFGLHYSGRT